MNRWLFWLFVKLIQSVILYIVIKRVIFQCFIWESWDDRFDRLWRRERDGTFRHDFRDWLVKIKPEQFKRLARIRDADTVQLA